MASAAGGFWVIANGFVERAARYLNRACGVVIVALLLFFAVRMVAGNPAPLHTYAALDSVVVVPTTELTGVPWFTELEPAGVSWSGPGKRRPPGWSFTRRLATGGYEIMRRRLDQVGWWLPTPPTPPPSPPFQRLLDAPPSLPAEMSDAELERELDSMERADPDLEVLSGNVHLHSAGQAPRRATLRGWGARHLALVAQLDDRKPATERDARSGRPRGWGRPQRSSARQMSPPPPSPPTSPPGDDSDRMEHLLTHAQASRLALEVGAIAEDSDGNVVPDLTTLCLADSGCGRSMGNHSKQFDSRSIVEHRQSCDTAAGTMVTKQRGTLLWTVPTNGPTTGVLKCVESTLNEACPYVLISVGRLSHEQGCAMWLPPDGKDGYMLFKTGLRVPLLNRNVSVIPPASLHERLKLHRHPSAMGALDHTGVYTPLHGDSDALVVHGGFRGTGDNLLDAPTLANLVNGAFLLRVKIGEGCFVQGVTRGKVASAASTTSSVIHGRWKHSSYQLLRLLSKAFIDIPAWWATVLRDEACDSCLQGNQRRLGATGSIPRERGLWYFDIWHNSTPFVHGGHTAVIGFIHSTTGLPYTIRLQRRRQAPLAFDMLCAFANSNDCPVTWCHCDNALELSKSKAMVDRCMARSVRITTSTAHRSRTNPMIERFWETMGMRMRPSQVDSGLPDSFWGYNANDAVDCVAMTPDLEPPHMCPLGKWLQRDVKAAYRRCWGCVCYPTLHITQRSTRSKNAPNSLRCIHLGYAGCLSGAFEELGYGRMITDGSSAPGYLCYDPTSDKIYRTPDVSFVENSFPGLARSETGGWTVPSPDFLLKARNERAPLTEADQMGTPPPTMEWTKSASPSFGEDNPDSTVDATMPDVHATEADVRVDGDTESDLARSADQRVSGVPPPAAPSPDGGVYHAPPDEPHAEEPPPAHLTPAPRAPAAGPDSAPFIRPEPFVLPDNYRRVKRPEYHPGQVREVPGPLPSHDERHGTVSDRRNRGSWSADHCEESGCTLPVGHPGLHSDHPNYGKRASGHATRTGSNYEKAMAVGLDSAFSDHLVLLGMERGTLTHDVMDEVQWVSSALAAMGVAEHNAVVNLLRADELLAEGHSLDEQKDARNAYAVDVLQAARHGVTLPPFAPFATMSSGLMGGICDEILQHSGEGYDDRYDGCLMHLAPCDLDLSIACLAKSKSSPDIYSERQMRGPEWDESKSIEVKALEDMGAFEWVLENDPRIVGMTPVDTLWTGRDKRNADLSLCKRKSRCCLRGDIHNRTYSLSKNQRFAPTTRDQTCLTSECVRCIRGQDKISADVSSAYLQGDQRKCEQVVAKPPRGWARTDENGVKYLWLMNAPLYGQGDAGAIWNRTFNEFVESDAHECAAPSGPSAAVNAKDLDQRPGAGLGMERCDYDPCLYGKAVGGNDDDRCSMTLYVDDIQCYNDPTPTARAEREQSQARTEARFKIKYGELNAEHEYILGTNIHRLSSTASHLCARSYIQAKCKVYLEKPIEDYPAGWSHLPVDPKSFLLAYEAALQLRNDDKCLKAKYNSLVGALQYAVRRRPDVCYAVNICARCLTFPTQDMYDHALRILVYMGRTHSLGMTYSKHAGQNRFECFADSDWNVRRSTTGWVIMLGGAAVGFASSRQHCIALSSTEAELMALATAAIELLFFMGIARALGEDMSDMPIVVNTDSSGAYDLCHRHSAGQNSRHVDRKTYKMRELRGSDVVELVKIDGEKNPADFFTKPLTRQPFERYRRFAMNLLTPVAENVTKNVTDNQTKE